MAQEKNQNYQNEGHFLQVLVFSFSSKNLKSSYTTAFSKRDDLCTHTIPRGSKWITAHIGLDADSLTIYTA